MIILSIGMPRAGSGWYYNLTNELMLAEGAQDVHQIRKRYHLQSILTEVNCNIGALTPRRLIAVLAPSLLGNTFVIKVHAGPTPFARRLIQSKFIRPTHIFRDPRDALLSAMENGQRSIERGKPNAFSSMATFDEALKFMEGYLSITEAWLRCNQVLQVRYEDLLMNYDHEVERLLGLLQIENMTSSILPIIEKYRPEKATPEQKGLHFSHGRIGRFRKKLKQEQQEILAQTLGVHLEHLGYEI